jgi:predicted ester cyclase
MPPCPQLPHDRDVTGEAPMARTVDRYRLREVNVRSRSAAATTENIAIVRRLLEEVLGRGRIRLLPELVADSYVGHFAIGDHYGPEGARIDVDTYRAAFPGLTVTIDDLFASGDRVARRFTLRGTHRGSFFGMPPTGRPVVLRGIAIDRLANGQLVESWVQVDALPLPRSRSPP